MHLRTLSLFHDSGEVGPEELHSTPSSCERSDVTESSESVPVAPECPQSRHAPSLTSSGLLRHDEIQIEDVGDDVMLASDVDLTAALDRDSAHYLERHSVLDIVSFSSKSIPM